MMMMLAINVIIIMMTKSIVHLFSCIANMYRLNKEIIRNQLVVMKQTYTYMLMLMYCQEGKGISNKEIIILQNVVHVIIVVKNMYASHDNTYKNILSVS